MVYAAKEIKAASSEGYIYESIYYSTNGAFSGWQAPGEKLMLLLYASPNVRLYFFQQIGEYLYYFPNTKQYQRYTPFSKDDAANFMTNYNKKLSGIFETCDFVKQKVSTGAYDLKKEGSTGHIKALEDYELNCGSGKPEMYFKLLLKEHVTTLYNQ